MTGRENIVKSICKREKKYLPGEACGILTVNQSEMIWKMLGKRYNKALLIFYQEE